MISAHGNSGGWLTDIISFLSSIRCRLPVTEYFIPTIPLPIFSLHFFTNPYFFIYLWLRTNGPCGYEETD